MRCVNIVVSIHTRGPAQRERIEIRETNMLHFVCIRRGTTNDPVSTWLNMLYMYDLACLVWLPMRLPVGVLEHLGFENTHLNQTVILSSTPEYQVVQVLVPGIPDTIIPDSDSLIRNQTPTVSFCQKDSDWPQ